MIKKSDQLAFSDCSRSSGFKSSLNKCSLEDYHISKEMSYRLNNLAGSAAIATTKKSAPFQFTPIVESGMKMN